MFKALLIDESTGQELELSVVESENPQRNNTITDNPVESGVNISDHVKAEPLKFSISGICSGDDAPQKVDMLSKFRNEATILTYIGRNAINTLVIESIDTTHDKGIKNGFKFQIGFKQLRIASQRFVDLTNVPIPARPEKNKGKQTVKQMESSNVQNALMLYAAQSKTAG